VNGLFLVDTPAPGGNGVPPDELQMLAAFGRTLNVPWERIPFDRAALISLSGRARLAYVLDQARRAGVDSLDLELAQVERFFSVFARHLEAARRYRPRRQEGNAVLLKAGVRPEAGPPAVDLGWGELIAGSLVVDEVPGDHETLLRSPQVAVLADTLGRYLSRT
jgi:thioesterase domain-containing protein